MTISRVVITILFLFLSVSLPAAVIHVPGDQPTIGAAIDAASAGDTVLLADGIYTGDGNRNNYFQGKAITVASESGPDFCIVDCENDGRAFLFGHGEGEDSVIDGLTLIHGSPYHVVYSSSNSSPTIRNCIIMDNSGGGIICHGGAVIRNNSILNNGDSGVYCGWTSSPIIEGNLVDGNTGGRGISCSNNSHPLVRNNTITNNSGGVGCVNSFAVITDNTIENNSATYEGGGINCDSGAPTITDNLIRGNTASHGGGIYCDDSAAVIHNNRIRDNAASSFGGGCCFSWSSDPDLANCEISGNSANYGGGIYVARSAALIRSSTIFGNTSVEHGGGLYSTSDNTSATLVNCILWSNQSFYGDEISVGADTTVTIRYSDVQGGQSGVWVVSGATLHWGDGMIDGDPLFTPGPLGGYYLGQTVAGQPADSPCLDSGEGQAAGTAIATGNGTAWLNQLSTRTDHLGDQGIADIGYHYRPSDCSTVGATIICQPSLGLLPFATTMTVTLSNLYADQLRRVAGRIDIELGDGSTVSGWRTGYANVLPLDGLVVSWNQALPALGALEGSDRFHFLVEDVTPTPYNQPPYWPSGGQDTDSCEVTGIIP